MALIPQQSGVNERRNRTIVEKARSIAHVSQLPRFLWTEAINTIDYLVNINPTRTNQSMNRNEKYYKAKPYVEHLKIFCSISNICPHSSQQERTLTSLKHLLMSYLG